MAEAGRDPAGLRVLPGVNVVVGRTDAEAQERHQYLQELIDPVVGIAILSTILGGADLSACDLDAPLPELPPTEGLTMGTAQKRARAGPA